MGKLFGNILKYVGNNLSGGEVGKALGVGFPGDLLEMWGDHILKNNNPEDEEEENNSLTSPTPGPRRLFKTY